jgi:hypothetical protein
MTRLLYKIPLLRQLLYTRDDLRELRAASGLQLRLDKEILTANLLAQSKYQDPKRLARHEAQVFSQNGEDGIIAEIFARIGVTDRVFVEFGAGDGMENNTTYLLFQGWSGFWFDGDESNIGAIRKSFEQAARENRLVAAQEFFTAERAAEILAKRQVPKEFDLLSIDIDRNTSWIWRSLGEYRPRVVVIEYNASIPPQDEWEIEYRADAIWDGTLRFGAGLRTLQRIGEQLGYVLVGCDLSGTNAFFVRNDLATNKFSAPFSAENHHEPPRYFLSRTWGHRRALNDNRP